MVFGRKRAIRVQILKVDRLIIILMEKRKGIHKVPEVVISGRDTMADFEGKNNSIGIDSVCVDFHDISVVSSCRTGEGNENVFVSDSLSKEGTEDETFERN